MTKITQKQAQEIIDLYLGGIEPKNINKLNLSLASIYNIINGTTWKQCSRPENINNIIIDRAKKARNKFNFPFLTEKQKSILIGSLLGDGDIKLGKLNHSFTKKQKSDRLEYLQWTFKELEPYSGNILKIYSDDKLFWEDGMMKRKKLETKEHIGYSFYTHFHSSIAELEKKWYLRDENGNHILKDNKRIKIIPKDIELTPLTIAIWFCDDGCNDYTRRSAKFCTDSFEIEEVEFLMNKLEKFNVKPNINKSKISLKTGKIQPQIFVHGQNYDNLIDLIKPYVIWDCFQYKIKWREGKKGTLLHNAKMNDEKIREIRKLGKTKYLREIAKEYNIAESNVHFILQRKTWKHIL